MKIRVQRFGFGNVYVLTPKLGVLSKMTLVLIMDKSGTDDDRNVTS